MAKKLVGRDNVEQFICHEENKLYVGKTLILTPGAKDYLQEKSIAVVYTEAPAVAEKSTPKFAVSSANDLNSSIQQLLKNDFSITDSSLVAEVTRKVVERLEQLK
jgi:ethanolamine utilization cobalamin adenosyltransferase